MTGNKLAQFCTERAQSPENEKFTSKMSKSTSTFDLHLPPTNLRNTVKLLSHCCQLGETCMEENLKGIMRRKELRMQSVLIIKKKRGGKKERILMKPEEAVVHPSNAIMIPLLCQVEKSVSHRRRELYRNKGLDACFAICRTPTM